MAVANRASRSSNRGMGGPARKAPVLWKHWLCMKAEGASEDRSSKANTSMSKGRGQHLLDQGVLGGQDLVVRDQGQVDLDAREAVKSSDRRRAAASSAAGAARRSSRPDGQPAEASRSQAWSGSCP